MSKEERVQAVLTRIDGELRRLYTKNPDNRSMAVADVKQFVVDALTHLWKTNVIDGIDAVFLEFQPNGNDIIHFSFHIIENDHKSTHWAKWSPRHLEFIETKEGEVL